jgi:predicted dehydrogenase
MKHPSNKLKALVIGCGSIGERHLHNLKKIGIKNIAIFDMDRKKVETLSRKYLTQKFDSLESALSFKPDFSVICTYPSSHLEIANQCINHGSHIFIEKPISSNIIGVQSLLKKADSRKLKVTVGYNLRFDPALLMIKGKLSRFEISRPLSISSEWGHNIKLWRPGKKYQNHYILRKGSGIILDDSHEYDYMRWLLDDEIQSVYCQTMQSNSIKTETESLAIMMFKFRKGTIGNLVIDYMRPNYERKCQIIGEKGSLKWNFSIQNGSWKNYNNKANSSITTILLENHVNKNNTFRIRSNDMYIYEMRNFVQSIIEDKEPIVNGWEGLKTLKIGMAALKSARTNKIVRL